MQKTTLPDSNPTKNVQLARTASVNDDKVEKLKILQSNVQHVIDVMKEEVKGNRLLPNGIFDTLFDDLQSLSRIIDPRRPLVCYCVCNTDAGKSSLINEIYGLEVCDVSNTFQAGTHDFQTVSVPEINTCFVDTIGFSSNLNDHGLVRKFEA
jgi:ribosome biogenesis GTPase A